MMTAEALAALPHQRVKLSELATESPAAQAAALELLKDTDQQLLENRTPPDMNAFDMNNPPPIWALAEADTFSVFDPVPVGVDQSGRPVSVSLQGTTLIGGVPRMGLSNLVRLLAVAAALDTRSEMHLYDLQGGLDYQCLAERAATFVAGGSPKDTAQVVNDLEHITADMARRYQTLHELDPTVCKNGKATEALATDPDLGLHPVFVIIDQPCFDHPEFRRLITQLIVQGPAAGINMILATSRTDTIPPAVATNAVNRLVSNSSTWQPTT